MRLRTILAATAVLVPGYAAADVPLPAMGQAPLSGLYIVAGVGANWLQNEHLINRVGTAAPGSISSHLGMVGVASIGYAFPMGLRVELEGDLRNNPISGAHDLGFAATAGGRERKYGPMVNVLYDLSPWIPPGYFSPYAGVGVGYQWTRLAGFHVNGSPTGFPSFTTGDTKGAIAYQFILGGAIPIPQVRGHPPSLPPSIGASITVLVSRDWVPPVRSRRPVPKYSASPAATLSKPYSRAVGTPAPASSMPDRCTEHRTQPSPTT